MRIAAFVPARMASVRLPGKLLLPMGPTTTLGYLLTRVRSVIGTDIVVVCTTRDHADDAIVREAERHGASVFRGDPDDIIARFDDAATHFAVDGIVNVDGDDAFCDPSLIEATVAELRTAQADFIRWTELPLGAAPVGFTAAALRTVRIGKTVSDTATGWGRFFLNASLFRIRSLQHALTLATPPDLRMTLDYPEDYLFLKTVFDHLGDNPRFGVADVVQLVERKPELLTPICGLNTAYWSRFENAAVDPTVRAATDGSG